MPAKKNVQKAAEKEGCFIFSLYGARRFLVGHNGQPMPRGKILRLGMDGGSPYPVMYMPCAGWRHYPRFSVKHSGKWQWVAMFQQQNIDAA